MRPFFCYYGGKWRAAPRYHAPLYPLIIEPFAGAAGYSTRYSERSVFLNDLDPVIARLWYWLINATPADVFALPLIGAGQDVRDLPIAPGAQDLIAMWLNKGCSRPRRTASTQFTCGNRPNSHWGERVRAQLAVQVDAIKHWAIASTSYETLPNVEATWFIDPPYAGRAGSHYSFGSKRIDYAHLADWCRSRRGQVIVCEADGADWLPFKPFGNLRAGAMSDQYTAEAIWTNG